MDFPLFSMAPFMTPFATKYDPNAATGNAVHARAVANQDEQAKATLAENQRQFNAELPLKQFETFGHQYTANRGQTEVETQHDTELLKWIHDVVQNDPAAAEKSAPFLHGILQSRGIDMQWDPQTGNAVGQQTRSPIAQPNQGESFQDFYGRLAKEAPAGVPKSGTTQDMIERYQAEHGPPSQPAPIQTDVERLQAEPLPQGHAPGFGASEDESLKELAQAQVLKPPPEAPTGAMGPLPGESLQHYFGRELAPQMPKAAPPPVEAPAPKAPKKEAAPASGEGIAVPETQTAPVGAPAEAPQGRWVFSKNGKELGAIDMAGIARHQQTRAAAEAEGFASSVLPAEDKALVEGMTKRLLAAGMTPAQVHEVITKTLEPELHRRSYERASIMAARSRAASAGTGSQDRLSYSAGSEIANKWLTDSGALDIQKGIEQLPELRSKLDSGNYNAVVGAAYNFARLNDPRGIVTDKDYEHALGKTLWDKVKDVVYGNDPTAPNLNPEEIKRMRGLTDVLEQTLKAKRAALIAAAPDRIKRMPSGEMQSGALDAFDSAFRGAEEWDKFRKSGPTAPPTPKATSSVRETTTTRHGNLTETQHDLLKKLEK